MHDCSSAQYLSLRVSINCELLPSPVTCEEIISGPGPSRPQKLRGALRTQFGSTRPLHQGPK